jgi:uncharacterized protein involved in exopolysaccharide biosynthesis
MKSKYEESKEPEDELSLAQFLVTLWKHRRTILVVTAIVTAAGLLNALLASPAYYSQATISVKEYGNGSNTNVLSQLGGLGGVVAAQLGGGNTSLSQVGIIAKGHELAKSVIVRNDLMPMLFPDQWESGKKKPSLSRGAEHLRKNVLSVETDIKKNVIQIGIIAEDPVIAKKLVDFYLEALNERIRGDAVVEAQQNRDFLENQLTRVADPILAEKINSLIAVEIEKMMFVSFQTIKILDGPMVPLTRSYPKRTKIVVVAFFTGLVLSVFGVFIRRGYKRLTGRMMHLRHQP